ncbi:MAG: PAS domain S-box protein, partial [Desulfomonilaceae bacterium]
MEKELHRRLRRRGWVALFVAVTLVILILGYGYYAHETERIRFQKYEDIAGIAKLKVGHIQAWRKGLLSAVSELSNGAAIKNWIREPDNDGPLKDLKDRLIVGQKQGGYADALLVDMDGNIIASASGQPESLNAVEDKAIEHAVASGSPLLTDLYRTPNGAILMDAVAPVLDPNGRSIAVAIYRANPESALFPLIQTWPTPSQTAETLLVRRDGDDVLFLNNLRHRANTALSLREPLTLHDLPAAQAVSAKKGLFQGIDYRGVEVLADLRPIPDSPWFMVAKVDTREILAEAYYRGAVVTVFSGLSILLAAGLTAYGYRSRQARLYKNLYQLDREERKTQELFLDQNVVLYNILESLPYPFYVIDAEDYSLSETNTASRLDNPQGADTCYGLTHHRSEPCSESEHPCPLQEVRKTGKPVIMEHIHFDKDSKPRNVEVHAYPIFDSQGKVIKMIEYSLDITERKLMEDDLRKTRQDWEDIFQSIGHPTIIMDREHRILAANKATIEASGKSLEELLNAKCYEIFHNSGEPPRGCPMEALLKSGSVEPVKMEMEALGRYFVVSCTPVLDKDGTIEKIIHIAIDITERKRAEDETQQNEVRLGKIVNLLHYKADSVQDFLDHALTEALKLTDSKIGYIYHYDEDSKEFVLNTWSTNVMKECSITNPPAVYQLEKTGIWGEAVRQRQPILVNDFQAPHPLKKGYPEGHAPLHRYLTVPDFCGDRIVAVVGVANKESDYNQIDTLQLTLLMNSVWKGVDRLKAEEKIRESEERFSKSFKNNPAFLTITHRGTYKVLEVNDAWTRAFGYTREEAIGRTIVELGIYDEATYRNIIEEAEAKGSVREIEVNIRNRTGEDRVLLISREVVEIQGEPCLLAMGIDITERQKAEKALLESEERYRTVADFTYDWEYWVDANGNFLYVSPSCERITGYSAEEFISDPELMNRIIHQDDRAGMLDHYHKVRQLTPNCVDARDFRVIHRDGETLSISHVCQPVYSPKGQLLGRRGSNRDISVRKQAEEALKISEERYCHVSTLTSDIAYSCLKSGSNAYSIDWLTGATKQILGYSLDDIRALKCWRNLVVDEDLPIFDRHVTGLTPGTSASSELRVRHKDGTIVWVSSFAECVLESESADGLRLYGGLKDITDSKRAEISLKETNAFLDTLVDTIPLPIFYKDTDGRYIGFNKSFEEFYGKARQEFIGKDVFDIYPRDLAETYHAKDLDLLRNPGIQVYEIQVEDSLGVIHDTIIHKSVFSDSQRHVAGLIGVILDVTEPNRVREELRRNEFRFSRAELIARLGNWEIDLSTKRVTASNGARRIYGVGQQELTLEDIQKIPLPEYK